jgi:hypothetical protein
MRLTPAPIDKFYPREFALRQTRRLSHGILSQPLPEAAGAKNGFFDPVKKDGRKSFFRPFRR